MPRLEDCKCGYCNYYYHVDGGCKYCLPAKERMQVPEETFEDETSLNAMYRQQMRILKTCADQLENEMHNKHKKDMTHNEAHGLGKDRGKDRYYADHGKRAMEMGKAAAALLGEVRKWEKQERESVVNLSFEQKLKIIVDMLEDFPLEYKIAAIEGVQKLLPARIVAEVVDDGQ